MISPGFLSCEHTLNTLRYANRVKELGADSSELKVTDEEDEMVNGEVDLASVCCCCCCLSNNLKSINFVCFSLPSSLTMISLIT